MEAKEFAQAPIDHTYSILCLQFFDRQLSVNG
jgi:hypothetical protein